MFFRTPRFIRRWLRARMHPMHERKAWSFKEKLSVAYMLIAWNCFGYVIWQMAKGNKHWPVTYGVQKEEETMIRPAYAFAKALGIQNAEVYRVDKRGVGEKEVITVENVEESTSAESS